MSELRIPVGAGDIGGYLAVPPVGAGPWPAVVVIHDAFGLTTTARLHADHLAAAGYLAVAPDLYSRGGIARCVRSTFSSLMAASGRPFDDIEAVRRWVAARPDTTARTGIIGFCMGGGFAPATAASGFAASAPNYGTCRRTCRSSTAPAPSWPATKTSVATATACHASPQVGPLAKPCGQSQ
jgi:carboxymethylenebutenolidase